MSEKGDRHGAEHGFSAEFGCWGFEPVPFSNRLSVRLLPFLAKYKPPIFRKFRNQWLDFLQTPVVGRVLKKSKTPRFPSFARERASQKGQKSNSEQYLEYLQDR